MPDLKPLLEKFKIKLIKPRPDEDKISKQWLLIMIPAAFFILLLILTTLILLFEIKYSDKFFPGSQIGAIRLEGATKTQALDLIDSLTSKLENEGLKIIYKKNNKELNLEFAGAVNSLSDPDLSRPLISYDNHRTIHEAFLSGRNESWWKNLLSQWQIISKSKKFQAVFTLDEENLDKNLRQQFSDKEKISKNAQAKINCLGEACSFEFLPEEKGLTFNYAGAINQLKHNLANLDGSPIELDQTELLPDIDLRQARQSRPLMEELLKKNGAIFTYKSDQWGMSRNEFAQILELRKTNGAINAGINKDALSSWLKKEVSSGIEVPAQNATIEIKDGIVTKLSTHQKGLALDLDKIFADLESQLASATDPKVELSVKDLIPDVATENINDLGIKEIIGIGQSNFAGSPYNRIHNIRNGASKIHGVLIKPGEEFSLIKTLGPVEGYTGYLPELVIKGNKTTPEFGGGLCQIGTTMFRAAMGSGLPVTERANHSYNVSYYLENGLPGTDATIYIPHPDVRFINDTGNYILIQTKIAGTKITFELWGTKDGRKTERTKPKVWGWVSPEPTKLVETLDLKPGVKKCTEKAHQGVNASFDYFITYADGTEKKQTFNSHYKPWQEVCLIGVEKLSDTDIDGSAGSSTEPITGGSGTTTAP